MKRSAEHINAQRAGKIRDLYTCQLCGSRENINGHHILDVQYGGSPRAGNIVALCGGCHKKAHFSGLFAVKF